MKFKVKKNLKKEANAKVSGHVTWKSPSNIALIKYWGKHGRQLPRNASISFTLSHACTETTVAFDFDVNTGGSVIFQFEGQRNEHFEKRIGKYLASIEDFMPFLKHTKLQIDSSNSFPHSTGIASSASAMSALALALCSVETEIYNDLYADKDFYRKASFIGRLGSGSAARSVYGHAGLWGKENLIKNSSDDYAIPFENELAPVFRSYRDTILIINDKEKEVSSSVGHKLMDNNPFSEQRYLMAQNNLLTIVAALKTGDLTTFTKVVEDEAMALHALMMLSEPSFILMKPETLAVIEKVRSFREQTGLNLCFTLDAGPNVHLLYPENEETEVDAFIMSDLLKYCKDGKCIKDRVGKGPQQIF